MCYLKLNLPTFHQISECGKESDVHDEEPHEEDLQGILHCSTHQSETQVQSD